MTKGVNASHNAAATARGHSGDVNGSCRVKRWHQRVFIRGSHRKTVVGLDFLGKTNSASEDTTSLILNHWRRAVYSALQLIVHGCPAAEDVVHACKTRKVKETAGMKPK